MILTALATLNPSMGGDMVGGQFHKNSYYVTLVYYAE